jgi:transcription elongation factor GreB
VASDPDRSREKVYFGAWVQLEDDEGERLCYRLVGPDESDPTRGHISMDSPVGRALLGRRIEDEVSVVRPRGRTTYVVLDIRYDSEPT